MAGEPAVSSGSAPSPGQASAPQAARLSAPTPTRVALHFLTATLAGRVIVLAAAIKLAIRLAGPAGQTLWLVSLVDAAATLALAISFGYLLWRGFVRIRRRVLWRVRRKLILSYIFIGLVPVLLIGLFFTLTSILMMLSAGSYLVRLSFDDLIRETELVADATLSQMTATGDIAEVGAEVSRRFGAVLQRYPEASLAIVPLGPGARTAAGAPKAVHVGGWAHQPPPETLPSWIGESGFSGLVALDAASQTRLAVRTIRLLRVRGTPYALVIDLPFASAVIERIRGATGISISAAPAGELGQAADAAGGGEGGSGGLAWVVFFDRTDWATGATGADRSAIRIHFTEFAARIFGAEARIGDVSVGYMFLLSLAIIGGLFLIIEVVALLMGFVLARSITGSIHELFVGTERVRRGDFAHRIRVATRDQLGELAESFNSMTRSVEDLLEQAAEKKRLEEELRIARSIQMSLLPTGPLSMPELEVTAVCIPAREVGGDYYDFFRLGERRIAILVADVAGKGTSAALYMAELKGLMLSLSQIYHSPKRLLVEANRILAANLDARSFITMTYAIVDLERRVLVYARAGHTPLLYLPAPRHGEREIRVFAPSGLVLGLQLDGFQRKFEEVLEESTLPLASGDVLVFFTDGITEAMNEEADLFGELRLGRLLEEHAHLPSDELRERILSALQTFVGSADQHDDMTMVVLKVGELGVPEDTVDRAAMMSA